VKARNYKEEILKILKENGGCFTGFNKFRRVGGFHATSLQNNLDEMEHQNKIKITRSKLSRGWTKFCLIKPHFADKLKLSDSGINKIKKLREKASTNEEFLFLTRCIIRIVFNRSKNIILGKLSYNLVDNYPMDEKELIDSQEHYWHLLVNELEKLKEPDRRRMINSLYEENPERSILRQINEMKLKKLHSSA